LTSTSWTHYQIR